MRTFHLRILDAEDVFVDDQAEMIIIPTTDGAYGIKAYHENVVFSIVPGLLTFRLAGQQNTEVFVASGMMRMEDNDALILVESCEYPEDIDEARAREKEAAAKEALLQKRSRQEYIMAQATLVRAVHRLKVKNHHR